MCIRDRVNSLNERTYSYEPERRVWAKIVPTAGRGEDLEGDMELSLIHI